ncbi:hypothetical protein HMPREF2765_01520 [Rothia sp. HMSC062H08]|uniref:hypothetical protein n=1 Tax=Rothia sp. HMSC062H08 TaxID=1739269 RepID=UPI0008A28EB9|nr:hypothetical protein [Rothia sp. HMSC062H08]OFL51431.1 hypothetical protein HMPREF2765_01520 [Rothia sp. HMSC062H08]
MTLLNTSGVLVILTVILLLWFVPRSLRRAPAGPVMEPERPLISAERTAEDILASAGVLLNESEAYQSSDHAVAPGTSLPSSALPQASSRSSHAVEDAVQPAPDTASISQIRDSSPTAPYTDEIPVVEESKPSPLSYFDTSSLSGIALLVAAGLGVLALVTGLLALFGVLAWGWAVLFLILAGGAWAVSRFGLLESLSNQIKANRDERHAKAEAEDAEDNNAEAYEESDDEKAYDDASEPVEDTEAPEAEAVEEPAHQARPATRETTVRNVSREAARPSRAHIAVESSDEAPEAAPRAEAPAAAPAHSSRPVPARSARPAEAPAGHRQERRQQRPSRFQPIRRGSVLFDQESGSATSSGAPRTAAQPQVAQAPVVPSQPAQPQPVQPQRAQRVPSAQPAQPAQAPVQAPAKPVAAQPAPATQAPAQPVAAPAQQPAIQSDQPVARQALRDGSPVRQAPAAPATQAPAQPIPEEIPLPDVLDDSEFDALDIASLNDSVLSTGATATGGVRSTNRHPGAGSSFEAVSNTWNPVQLPKPLSALHRQDKNQGKK